MSRYVLILLGVAAVVILSAVSFSVALDPYRIVHPLLGEFGFEPNSRVPKLKFLLTHCARYDSYFVGDSRSASLSERDLPDMQGHRFYNFSTPADNISSIVRRLEFLLDRGCPISTVIVEESIDVLLDNDESRAYSLLLSENPRLSGESWLAFYSKYFLSVQSLSTYFGARRREPVMHDIYYPDGHADYLWEMRDGSSFLLPRCGAPKLTANQKQLLPAKLAGYRELARLARQHHFVAVVWIAPLNRWESSLLDDPDIADFRRQLGDMPDMSIVEADRESPALADFHYWHDCGHFRRAVFDQLLAPSVSKLLAKGSR
jgi:hypothetical protein